MHGIKLVTSYVLLLNPFLPKALPCLTGKRDVVLLTNNFQTHLLVITRRVGVLLQPRSDTHT
jgi:hypothetical protein